MKVGDRGQVTIPKSIRDRFGINSSTEVEFAVERGAIVLRKKAHNIDLDRWKGFCANSFKKTGYASVDAFIEDVRGR
jgi:AbrB family looped-hinge helix DNA binding protein